jgi:hypothetical protein
MAVPSPGDLRQVLDLVTLLELAPFDSNTSPWDMTVIEGLEGGRAALFLRAHHSLTDGLHGVSLVRRLLDEPVVAAAPAPAPETRVVEAVDAVVVVDDPILEWELAHRRRPGTVSITFDVAGAVTGAVRPIAHGVVAAMRADPVDAVVRRVQHSLDVVDSVSRQVVVTGGRLSQLSPSRSMNSRFEAFSVDGAEHSASSRRRERPACRRRGQPGRHHEGGRSAQRVSSGVARSMAAAPRRWIGRAGSGGDTGGEPAS